MTTPAKKTAAAKKTASTPAKSTAETTPDETTSTPATDTAEQDGADSNDAETGPETASGFVQNYGPGTSNPDVPAENSLRPPATVVNTDPAAAPLTPPADSHLQTEPLLGHDSQSTSHTYAESGGRTIAGEHHYRLVGADLKTTLDPDDLFEDPDPVKTTVLAKQDTYEEFCYPNSHTPTHRRVFGKGTPVPRFQALKITEAAKADYEAEQAAAGSSTPAE